ncbi:MAG: membrane protein [Parcubacteria group bacterium Gr01-1014_29]|nr:MAG: membrane protein [Parcubacteria group bacterium Gr01-1014_29]
MDVISLIISIIVLFVALGLKKRVGHLEQLIESRGIASRREILSDSPVPVPLENLAQPAPFEVGVPLPKTAELERPSLFGAFVRWAEEDWLMKLGALLLLIGFGWLVRYAFLNNWIGPVGRITLGIACGVLFLAGGWWRMQRFTSQGSVFLALGSGIVLLSIFAARFLYDFFTPLSALIVMFLSVAFVALASVRFRVRSLSIMVAWMIVFSAGAFFVFKTTAKRVPFFAYAAVSVALLASATAVELEGARLTIAYIIESACVSLVIYAALRDTKLALRSTLLLVGPAALSIQSIMAREWRYSVLHEHFFVLLLFASVLCALGIFFGKRIDREHAADRMGSALLLVFGSIYYYVLLWLSLHAGFKNDDTAVMIALAVYTVIGIICYFYQEADQSNHVRAYGGALLGFVVGRLLIVDVWNMALTGRIITFFLIGTLLISTAFLWRKKSP